MLVKKKLCTKWHNQENMSPWYRKNIPLKCGWSCFTCRKAPAEEMCYQGTCLTWSEWTQCSEFCGGGTQQRFRSDRKVESSKCNLQTCPIEPGLTWSSWSFCSAKCGPGVQRRVKRKIISSSDSDSGYLVPTRDLKYEVDEQECNMKDCEVPNTLCKTMYQKNSSMAEGEYDLQLSNGKVQKIYCRKEKTYLTLSESNFSGGGRHGEYGVTRFTKVRIGFGGENYFIINDDFTFATNSLGPDQKSYGYATACDKGLARVDISDTVFAFAAPFRRWYTRGYVGRNGIGDIIQMRPGDGDKTFGSCDGNEFASRIIKLRIKMNRGFGKI